MSEPPVSQLPVSEPVPSALPRLPVPLVEAADCIAMPCVAMPALPLALRTVLGVAALVVGTSVAGGIVVTVLVLVANAHRGPLLQLSVLLIAGAYTVIGIAAGTAVGIALQRRTVRWVARGTTPTEAEARRALRLPVDLAVVHAVLWLGGALVIGLSASLLTHQAALGWRVATSIVLGGLTTAGVIYLLVARAARPVTTLALAACPPDELLTLGVTPRLLLTWLLTTAIPLLGVLQLAISERSGGPSPTTALVALVVVVVITGGLSTVLVARGIGTPLRGVLGVLQEVGRGRLDVAAEVSDASEIGLLQAGVNSMIDGLRERDRIEDLFGRHVGPAVAAEALRDGVTLSGQTLEVVALFIDITGSTRLARQLDPQDLVAVLNRFFQAVVQEVEDAGGLVNKFEGDAALCVFGAPAKLADPATAALRAARRIRRRVRAAGELDVGIGVSAGTAFAGQVGAASRLEYTVIGDPVNEAARLSEQAKLSPGRALASAAAVLQGSPAERVHWTERGELNLRGRGEPTSVWECAAVD